MNKRVCDHEACECDAPRTVKLNRINFPIVCAKMAGIVMAVMAAIWAAFKILG